ncbi:NAD dehydrogenase [Mycena floridula]|nr:NAD dehydrogenase [Mycena floridula]
MSVRGLTATLNAKGRFSYKNPEHVVDHLVIGGGIVGLAIAARLSKKFPSQSTFVVERHPRSGEEISSRNSEVIHSGLYYPPESLKTRLCLRGRDLLYQYCDDHKIAFKRTGKLVVAVGDQEKAYIENLHQKSLQLKWPVHTPSARLASPVLPTELISGDQARKLEPSLSKEITGALWCPLTGIIDSHGVIGALETEITNSEGGNLVHSTQVVRIDPKADAGWVVQLKAGGSEEGEAVLARTVINAAGLSSALILNAVVPPEERIPMYYARGSYAKYNGPGIAQISHLIYPCPPMNDNMKAFQSLGTHLTLDLDGNVRFGPDIEWLTPPSETDEEHADFWSKHLVPDDSKSAEIYRAVTRYLPFIKQDGLQPDYVGIRPKLESPSSGFQDFLFRQQFSDAGKRNPIVHLCGIESPGLTSSLAIAEYVVEDILNS